MSLPIYNPSQHEDKIFFDTRTDFGGQRCVVKPIHIVQYDKSLPVIAVALYKNGATYTLPSAITSMKIRWGKKDHTFVIKDVLGMSEDRRTAYFEIDEQMTFFDGSCNPILELRVGDSLIGSASLPFEIDRNPVQIGDIESHSEYPEFEQTIQDVKNIKEMIPEDASIDNKLATEAYVDEHGGGGGPIDTAMSDTSSHAVQNKVIKAYVDNIGSVSTQPNTLVRRDENHFVDIRVHTPQYDDEPASKQYVDEHTPTNVVTKDEVNVYAIPDTIVRRNNESSVDIRVRTIPEYDNEPASKKYVDDHSTGAETPFYEHRITWNIQKDGTILIGTTIAYGNSGVALTNNTVSISIPNDDSDEWNLYPMHMLSVTSTVIEEIIGIKYMPSTQTFRVRGRYGSETASNFDFTKDNIIITDRVSPIGIVGSVSIISAEGKMDQNNPVGYGSFSMNRRGGTTIGTNSFAEGSNTTASGNYSHAEGNNTTASGNYSHAEGNNTEASGLTSHAEGGGTKANENYSHAEGFHTITRNFAEHASGEYNKSNRETWVFGDSGNTLFSVGNGTSEDNRKNAFEIWQDGRASVQTAPRDETDVVRKKELDESGKLIDVYDSFGNVYAHMKVVLLSNQAEYDAITTKDGSTLYIILG